MWKKDVSMKTKIIAIVIVVVGIFLNFKAIKNYTNSEKNVSGDLASMVYVNSTLYIISENNKYYDNREDDFKYLGVIQSKTHTEPSKNFQANDDIIGSAIYKYKDDIVVLIDGKYWLYRRY